MSQTNHRTRIRPTVAHRSNGIFQIFLPRFISVVLIVCILSSTTLAAPTTIMSGAESLWQSIRLAALSSQLAIDMPNFLATLFRANSNRQDDEIQEIDRVKIFPGSVTVAHRSKALFSAVAFDKDGDPIHGLSYDWTFTDSERQMAPRAMLGGTFDARRRGVFIVKASTGGYSDEVTVTVESAGGSQLLEKSLTAPISVSSRSDEKSEVAEKKQGEGTTLERTSELMPEPDGWNDDNWGSLDDPGNMPGNPPGSPVDGGAGNGNFQLSAPVLASPGRGIDLALSLNYNSRVWNKAGNQMTYDIDRGSPAPGWSFGFGKMIYMGPQAGCMLVDADGTRHGYSGSIQTYGSGGFNFKGRTADGSFIDYSCLGSTAGAAGGWAKLPNGTEIQYTGTSGSSGQLVPWRVKDPQGNYVSISYKAISGDPVMETITDTLGRVILFEYDSANRITAVIVPKYGTKHGRKAVVIQYKEITLGHSFASGITTSIRDSTPHVIEAIYYPGTNTGYWFGDSDSYSSYGMITKVVEQRGMSLVNGVIQQGTMTKQALYNYPLTTGNVSGRTNGIGLTDAPTYETLTESWDGADVAEPAVTTYKVNQNSSPRTTTVIQPNGTVNQQYSYNNPGQFNDGLVYLDETYVPDPNGSLTIPNVTGTFSLAAKSNVTWAAGNYDSPRPTLAEVFDENGDKVKTEYTYGSGKFNQVTRSCDYDSNTLLRCSNAEYENDASYIGSFNTQGQFQLGRHIFNLVKSTSVENASGTKVSRADYEYDNYSSQFLSDAPGVVQHDYLHDPYTTETYPSDSCLLWSPPNHDCTYEGQEVYVYGDLRNCECEEWQMVSAYDPSTEKRGNITKVTTYSDAQSATGAVIETRGYDKTGNVVKISSACCEETTISYDNPNTAWIDSHYAYPISQTRGSSDPNSPHRITTSSIYDSNTGLVKETTDANGRTSTPEYDAETLRLTKSTSSTGAYSTLAYDDTAMTVTEEVKEANGTLAGKTVKHLNGIGQVRKEESFAPNSIIDIVETTYTKFGEEWKQSRPYRANDTVQWSERFYDAQRRLIKVVEPDGSETKAFYNESTLPDSVTSQPGKRMRVMDAWGRERWGRYDQQGRLVQVVEPNPDTTANPTGSVFATGSLLTKYKYDTQNRLIETEQGAQVRKFKYDDLGRLTRQKLSEQTATLNDSGVYVGAGQAGANWSNAFFYDGRSNLTQKTDARGVKTMYSFDLLTGGGQDPLNRLQKVSYDHTGPMDTSLSIHAAQPTFYTYMTSGDKSRVQGIYTQAILAEEFTYDVEGRVSENKQTVEYRPNHPFTTNYLYDTLDRVKEVHYPAQYGLAGSPRKIVANTYDTASRLSGMTVGGQTAASDIVYNASDQTTQMKVGTAGTNQVTEEYTFDSQTGLLTNQKATKNGSTTLLDLSYQYNRGGSAGSLNGKTGHVTKVVNNLDTNKNREYEFDALGRLTKAKGGTTGALWNQQYSYDRYGNRTNVAASGTAADNSPIPLDGIPNLAYDNATNRITTSGYQYDVNGNQIRALAEDGVTWLKFDYDSANRLRGVRKDDTNQTLLQWFEYASSNARLLYHDPATNLYTIFASVGGTVLAEYTEFTANVPTWVKSYVYLSRNLLSTITPNGQGGEYTEYNHPDRLGTRTITNQAGGTSYEQAHLPFGRPLDAESTTTGNNKRFTSYDRSAQTGLDYAINRTYDSKQGRFTQVDPIGIQAANLEVPQTLNMYSYCGNDPINHTDPEGLFWNTLKKFFKTFLRVLLVATIIALTVYFVAPVAIGLIAGGGGWATAGGYALLFLASVVIVKAIGNIVTGIRESIYKCKVPDFNGLSQKRQDELSQRGVSSEQWNSLKNKQRLGYFNIVAAIGAAGLSLFGWFVDWDAGGIQQDRVFWVAAAGAVSIFVQVTSSSLFQRSNGNADYPKGYRFKTLKRSLQLKFSKDGNRINSDVDYFNPTRGIRGFVGHSYEVVSHILGKLIGHNKTNPYNMAARFRSSWECSNK